MGKPSTLSVEERIRRRRESCRRRREQHKANNLALVAIGNVPSVGLARCGKCKEDRPRSDFSKALNRANGLQNYCKPCARVSNPYRGRVERFRVKRRWFNDLLDRIKAEPCSDCGRCFPTVCMDFDHRDPHGKMHNVARMALRSEELIMREIAKCDLVCANCHRVREQVRRKLGSNHRASVSTPREATPVSQ